MIKLIVGLGNPGQKYTKNRHNAGFLLLDGLARDSGGFSQQARFFGCLAEMSTKSGKLYLLKPATFMNRSGQSVSAVMKYFKILPEEVLVVHDELDFDVGVVKLKKGGGHGGHNGLRDIITSMGQKNFLRLRIGIGRPRAGKAVADYVLSDFSKVDMHLVQEVFADFAANMSAMCSGDYGVVMQNLHSREKN
ncbi:MAG: peptidyl-tRNA hydrolase, PTH1 family [Methyloprofundus sp.]|nr:MAG: peptidyl-tRNA hydrolase, PTH1 family [Methyloprofundus sp.]